MLKAIWAMTEDWLVGRENSLPWRIKEELEHFRKTTLNKDILMGKNTYLSLPDSFDQRNVYVLTKDPSWKPPLKQCIAIVTNSYEPLINRYKENKERDLYVCGGISVYQELVPYCDELIVSIVKGEYEGDRYLTNIDLSTFQITKVEKHEKFDVLYYSSKHLTE